MTKHKQKGPAAQAPPTPPLHATRSSTHHNTASSSSNASAPAVLPSPSSTRQATTSSRVASKLTAATYGQPKIPVIGTSKHSAPTEGTTAEQVTEVQGDAEHGQSHQNPVALPGNTRGKLRRRRSSPVVPESPDVADPISNTSTPGRTAQANMAFIHDTTDPIENFEDDNPFLDRDPIVVDTSNSPSLKAGEKDPKGGNDSQEYWERVSDIGSVVLAYRSGDDDPPNQSAEAPGAALSGAHSPPALKAGPSGSHTSFPAQAGQSDICSFFQLAGKGAGRPVKKQKTGKEPILAPKSPSQNKEGDNEYGGMIPPFTQPNEPSPPANALAVNQMLQVEEKMVQITHAITTRGTQTDPVMVAVQQKRTPEKLTHPPLMTSIFDIPFDEANRAENLRILKGHGIHVLNHFLGCSDSPLSPETSPHQNHGSLVPFMKRVGWQGISEPFEDIFQTSWDEQGLRNIAHTHWNNFRESTSWEAKKFLYTYMKYYGKTEDDMIRWSGMVLVTTEWMYEKYVKHPNLEPEVDGLYQSPLISFVLKYYLLHIRFAPELKERPAGFLALALAMCQKTLKNFSDPDYWVLIERAEDKVAASKSAAGKRFAYNEAQIGGYVQSHLNNVHRWVTPDAWNKILAKAEQCSLNLDEYVAVGEEEEILVVPKF